MKKPSKGLEKKKDWENDKKNQRWLVRGRAKCSEAASRRQLSETCIHSDSYLSFASAPKAPSPLSPPLPLSLSLACPPQFFSLPILTCCYCWVFFFETISSSDHWLPVNAWRSVSDRNIVIRLSMVIIISSAAAMPVAELRGAWKATSPPLPPPPLPTLAPLYVQSYIKIIYRSYTGMYVART